MVMRCYRKEIKIFEEEFLFSICFHFSVCYFLNNIFEIAYKKGNSFYTPYKKKKKISLHLK